MAVPIMNSVSFYRRRQAMESYTYTATMPVLEYAFKRL